MSKHFRYESPFYKPQFLEVLVHNLIKEDSIENNEKNVRQSLEAIISLSETMIRTLEAEEAMGFAGA
jgi:hypothetical protein